MGSLQDDTFQEHRVHPALVLTGLPLSPGASMCLSKMAVSIGSVWGVTDLDRATSFWTQALRYRLKREPDIDFAMLMPDGDGATGI